MEATSRQVGASSGHRNHMTTTTKRYTEADAIPRGVVFHPTEIEGLSLGITDAEQSVEYEAAPYMRIIEDGASTLYVLEAGE